MSPISQSTKYILLHSKLFLVIILLFITITTVIEFALRPSINEFKSLAVVLNLSVFLGVYLAGGLVNLKKNYLWKISRKYKNSLLNAYFLLTTLVNIFMALLLYQNYKSSILILLLPFCVTVFASQMILGKNILFKVLVTATPILIAQLFRINVGMDMIVLLIIVATVVLIFTMYQNLFYTFRSHVNVDESHNVTNTVAFMTTGFNAAQLTTINYYIGLIVAKWVTGSRKLIDWAILMPHTRLGAMAVLYLLLTLSGLFLLNEKMGALIQGLAVMSLPIIIILIIPESRNLIRQTRTVAHVFVGKQHRQLKNKILFSLDKNILVNVLIYIIGYLLMIKILSLTIIFNTLILSFLVITIFTLSVYPYLLCLNWVNLSVLLIGSMTVYAGLIYKIIGWINLNNELALTLPYIASFLVACLLLRAISQYIFWQRPFEALLKNK